MKKRTKYNIAYYILISILIGVVAITDWKLALLFAMGVLIIEWAGLMLVLVLAHILGRMDGADGEDRSADTDDIKGSFGRLGVKVYGLARESASSKREER